MNNIDFVITWVDGNDPEWLLKKQSFKSTDASDTRNIRYRDWDLLKYWFRGVEKYAPWVRKVFFVTEGHIPSWLNINNPKLVIVKHEDFIPNDYLPTFSCRPIEFNFHRIKDLSETFVYFNDDMFLLDRVKPSFFFVNNKPRDTAVLNSYYFGGIDRSGKILKTNELHLSPIFNIYALNNHFDKNETIIKHFSKWFSPLYGMESFRTLSLIYCKGFPGLMCYHLPYSLLKTTYYEVWEKNKNLLETACNHKFRETTDVSSWLLSFWQIAKGNFIPRSPNVGKQFNITEDFEQVKMICDYIKQQKGKVICINDSFEGTDYSIIKSLLIDAFNCILSDKSSFEL